MREALNLSGCAYLVLDPRPLYRIEDPFSDGSRKTLEDNG